jgi:hypothetical protein
MNLIFHDFLGVLLEVYIDDLVIKSADFEGHMTNLRLVLEKIREDEPPKVRILCDRRELLGDIVEEDWYPGYHPA